MSRELSAKDKAFLAEKAKLQKQIRDLKNDVIYWKNAADAALETSAKFETLYFDLLDKLDLGDEEFKAHLERTKKLESLLKPLEIVGSMNLY